MYSKSDDVKDDVQHLAFNLFGVTLPKELKDTTECYVFR